MSTAILLSGEARTFKYCLTNLRHYVFSKLPDPIFYVSVADDEQAADMKRLREFYPNTFIEVVKQPQIPEPVIPAHPIAGWANTSPPQAVLRQLWHLSRVWDFYCENSTKTPNLVVRCRPDLFFRKFIPHALPAVNLGLVPYWGGYGGINDRFALLPPNVARLYFNAYAALPSLLAAGCPFHPETIMGEVVKGYVRRTLRAEFCIMRLPNEAGELRLVEPDIRPGDTIDFLAESR